jgi:cell division protein FtsQ
MTSRLRRLLVAAGVVAVAALVVAGVPAVRRLGFFRLRQVEVIGTRYLDETDLVSRLGLRPDASTLDPLGRVRRVAASLPGVTSVTVERRLPGTLRITLREAVPVALAPLSDRLALIDSRAHVLPFDPVRVPASLPVAGRDSATAGLLGRLMQSDPVMYDSLETAYVDRGDVVLDTGTHRIRMRPGADDDLLRAVMAVRAYLAANGIAWREIDARYRDHVFVRKATT